MRSYITTVNNRQSRFLLKAAAWNLPSDVHTPGNAQVRYRVYVNQSVSFPPDLLASAKRRAKEY